MSSPFATIRAALGLAALVGWLSLCGGADAQEKRLPACPSNQNARWDNCFGMITFPSGESYSGDFQKGVSNGNGTSRWADGRQYVGGYKDGKRHGHGTLTYSDGERFVGEFRDGQRIIGNNVSSNGERYVGEYKDGQRHGNGTLYFPDGTVFQKGR